MSETIVETKPSVKRKRTRRIFLCNEDYDLYFRILEGLCETAREIFNARRATDNDRMELLRVLARQTFARADWFESKIREADESRTPDAPKKDAKQ